MKKTIIIASIFIGFCLLAQTAVVPLKNNKDSKFAVFSRLNQPTQSSIKKIALELNLNQSQLNSMNKIRERNKDIIKSNNQKISEAKKAVKTAIINGHSHNQIMSSYQKFISAQNSNSTNEMLSILALIDVLTPGQKTKFKKMNLDFIFTGTPDRRTCSRCRPNSRKYGN